MPEKLAKTFIITALCFYIIGCVEGILFPIKFTFQSTMSTLFHIDPGHVKSFFGHFVAKIHTHVNLIGWVGSALMGILYYLAPRISGCRRYLAWAAWGNWLCQTFGVLLLSTGFHLVGVFGLASGFPAGSPEFRAAAAPFKSIVILGGILITLSALLFALNMVRTLLLAREPAGAAMRKAAALSLVIPAAVLLAPLPSHASPAPVPETAAVIMVGDRIVDIAHGLGVVPAAMSVRCSLWPMCPQLKAAVQVLGCPSCLAKKKAKPLLDFAGKMGIKRVILEKGSPFCSYTPGIDPAALETLLKQKGFIVDTVAYTGDFAVMVTDIARLLGREKKGTDLAAAYKKQAAKVNEFIKSGQFPEKVVIFNGIFQEKTGKSFLRVEAPGGYADQHLLAPLGCKNTGGLMKTGGKKVTKGHFTIRKLDALLAADPDAIVITGDAAPVQKALSTAVKQHPELAGVPAIQSHAVYALPGYINGSLKEYPGILMRWAHALKR